MKEFDRIFGPPNFSEDLRPRDWWESFEPIERRSIQAEVGSQSSNVVLPKQFEMRELHEAIAHAKAGGIALHVHTLSQNGHRLFRRYEEIGHLFDQDEERLVDFARKLGVRVIKVEKPGTDRQHIDLCGRPFLLAKSACDYDEDLL